MHGPRDVGGADGADDVAQGVARGRQDDEQRRRSEAVGAPHEAQLEAGRHTEPQQQQQDQPLNKVDMTSSSSFNLFQRMALCLLYNLRCEDGTPMSLRARRAAHRPLPWRVPACRSAPQALWRRPASRCCCRSQRPPRTAAAGPERPRPSPSDLTLFNSQENILYIALHTCIHLFISILYHI